MPIVTDFILAQLRQQIKEHGAVIWYDPQGHYQALAAVLQPADVGAVALHRYDPEHGFLWLRRELEPIWGQTPAPPRLLIYVPRSRQAAGQALVEFEVGGAIMGPGEQPAEHNTALAAVTKRALQGVLPPAALDRTVSETEAGKWSLVELDQEAARGAEAQAGVLKLIFGSGNAAEIALRFLADSSVDAGVQARDALPSLARFLNDTLGAGFSPAAGAGGLRSQVARHVLLTDFILSLGDNVPPALQTFPLASQPAARQAAADLARAWRDRRDLAGTYLGWADVIEREFGIAVLTAAITIPPGAETFRSAETRLQQQTEEALLRLAARGPAQLAAGRIGAFWSAHDPEIKTRWELIASASQVLGEARRLNDGLKGKVWRAGQLVAAYASGEAPWCLLDTAQRRCERDFDRFDADPGRHDSLLKLVAKARQAYAAAAGDLAERFIAAYEEAQFEPPGVLQQIDICRQHLLPAVQAGKTAYILVDALRFEMARELQGLLDVAWQQQLTVALATAPTITEVGMAALMPGAEEGLSIAPATNNRVAGVVAGRMLASRAERVAYFKETIQRPLVETKLADLAPLRDKALSQSLDQADVILVTATEEIDGICENTPTLARRLLDDALIQLRRGLNTLFKHGVRTAVITADHGYLFFGASLSQSEGIQPPGGQTAALKRRVWVGKGGASQSGLLRKPLSAFGIGGDLEIATPHNLAYFSVPGGSLVYFHGGLSLPELAIPVLVVSSAVQTPAPPFGIVWQLKLGSKSISTRFISLTVEGKSESLLPVEPPPVRAEVRAGDRVLSAPVSASYGFRETAKDVELRAREEATEEIEPCTITLLLEDIPDAKMVTVHLLDANTGLSLKHLSGVPIHIAL